MDAMNEAKMKWLEMGSKLGVPDEVLSKIGKVMGCDYKSKGSEDDGDTEVEMKEVVVEVVPPKKRNPWQDAFSK